MFSEDELHQARAVSVLEIAERHGAKLKSSGSRTNGPCPVCGGDDRFSVVAQPNVAGTAADATPAATPSRSKCT